MRIHTRSGIGGVLRWVGLCYEGVCCRSKQTKIRIEGLSSWTITAAVNPHSELDIMLLLLYASVVLIHLPAEWNDVHVREMGRLLIWHKGKQSKIGMDFCTHGKFRDAHSQLVTFVFTWYLCAYPLKKSLRKDIFDIE